MAISSNDAENYPDDSPAGLKQQAQTHAVSSSRISTTRRRQSREPTRRRARRIIYLFDNDFKLVYRGQFDGSSAGKWRSRNRRRSAGCAGCGAARRKAERGPEGFDRVQYQVEELAELDCRRAESQVSERDIGHPNLPQQLLTPLTARALEIFAERSPNSGA